MDLDGNEYFTPGEPFTDTNDDGMWTLKDYTPSWNNCISLIGDINSNEIMQVELGLEYVDVKKKKDGYFIG